MPTAVSGGSRRVSTALAVLVSVPAGIIQAVYRNKTADHLLNAFSAIFYATPAFLTGTAVIIFFAIKFPIFPPQGPQGEDIGAIVTNFKAVATVAGSQLSDIAYAILDPG